MVSVVTTHKQERAPRYWQGEQAGQAEAQELLAEAIQQKGAPLTKMEILEHYGTRYQEGITAWKRGETDTEWIEGWWRGLATACIAAQQAITDRSVPQALLPPPTRGKAPVPVTFRKATLLVNDPGEFLDGIDWGQIAQVEDEEQLTVSHLFQELASNLVTLTPAHEQADWLLGYLLGRVDALLRNRQVYPTSGKK